MPESVETVVIGGGQAGLCMSHHLSSSRREHLVLERGRIVERWRSERWDSLAFQFPNWTLRLPGFAYGGDEPDGFMIRDGIVRFLEEYARRVAPPIVCGMRVTAVSATARGRFLVETEQFALEAMNVVVATGPYQVPLVPVCSRLLPLGLFQLTANRYINPRQLPEGSVLVVGSGGSGCQIAEDLIASGRRVYLAVGRHHRVPRRYRGKDFGWWQEQMGMFDVVPDALRSDVRAPLLSGVDNGHDVDLRRLAERGVVLAGRLRGISGGRLYFSPDLGESLAQGDAALQRFMRAVDRHVSERGLAAPAQPVDETPPTAVREIPTLDVKAAGITAVIWCLGYRCDFDWLKLPVFDATGKPIHRRGVTALRGLYFLGLPWLYKRKSAFLWGVGEDAAHLAEHITRH